MKCAQQQPKGLKNQEHPKGNNKQNQQHPKGFPGSPSPQCGLGLAQLGVFSRVLPLTQVSPRGVISPVVVSEPWV